MQYFKAIKMGEYINALTLTYIAFVFIVFLIQPAWLLSRAGCGGKTFY